MSPAQYMGEDVVNADINAIWLQKGYRTWMSRHARTESLEKA